MFKLQKHKSGKVGEKFDFQFFDFQAIKVPRGWDKLFVSIASHDTGKTIVKSGKASVKNGVCRWAETFRESVSISQEKGEAKELQGCLIRFSVAMGSSRSGILGEATVNLSEYASLITSVPVSLLLKKCNYGTSIQLKIQCLTPKTKNRDVHSRQTNVHVEYGNNDIEIKSDASDGAFSRNLASMSGTHLESTSKSQAGPSRDPSLSASDSRQSFDSIEASSGNDIFSPQTNLFGPVTDLIVRQDSSESQISGPSHSVYVRDDGDRSNHSSVHSRAAESYSSHVFQQEEQSSNAASSKGLLEAAEVTIEEFRAEARMWERNAKKLTLNVEALRKETSEQSRSQETLSMELAASQEECNGLNQEIKHLKSLLEEAAKKKNATVDLGLQTKDIDEMQKQIEEEIRIHKDSNANLTEQLQKAQESNIELLSILQELEAIIETQKLEIENLSSQKLKLQENENQCLDAKMQFLGDSVVKNTTQEPDEQLPQGISNIKLQLEQLQETQEELESTILLLEKSVEEKDREIERERDIRTQDLLDSESKWRLQVAAKEEEIMKLEAMLSGVHIGEENNKLEVETGDETDLAKEVGFLRKKVEDLEDCKELTEENLELFVKLKEPETSLLPPDGLVDSSYGSYNDNSRCTCGTEVSKLRDQLEELQRKLTSKETLVEHAATSAHSHFQYLDLEYKCHELEIQLQTYMEKVVHLENKLQEFHVQGEEQQTKIHSLQQQIKEYEANKTNTRHLQLVLPNANVAASPTSLSHILSELHKLLDHTLKLTKRKGNSLNFSTESSVCCFHDLGLTCDKSLTCEEQLHLIFDSLSKTNKCFEGKCNMCRNVIKHAEDAQEEDIDEEPGFVNCISHQGPLKSKEVIEADLAKELAVEASEIKALKSDTLRKEEEIEFLQKKLNTLEDQIANVHDENLMLQENIKGLEREKISSSEFLEELKNENMILKSSVELHISASKALERLSSELGKGKEDVEQHLSELEQENIQFSERISALEAQLRYLIDEKETYLLDLQHSESQSRNLHDDISRLELEMEAQKVEASQKLRDVKKCWLEAQEELEYLKKANPKLQATAENLIEECTALQKCNGELRRQNMELHTHCTILESKLRDTQAKIAESSERIEALEAEFLMLVEEVSIKAKSLNSELDSLVTEDKGHREKVLQENSSLNDMYMEKVIEVESYQSELAHLIDQISLAHNDQETVASEAINEVSVLRADKAKLELSLQELTGKFAISQSKLSTLEAETEAKVKQLTEELTSLRESQEILMANHENLLVSVERFRISEENHKNIINRLEIDLKASEYERLQLTKEISSLKEKLQRTTLIQAELLDLKTSFSGAKFEYERLKALNELLSRDHEELKAEKDSLVQKITSMQKSLLESEDCQRSKVALEEKVLRLEGDLAAREALCSQDAELKFELSKMKRANGELQRKVKHLEQDQEQLQLKNQAMRDQVKYIGKPADTDDEHIAALSFARNEKRLLEIPYVSNSDYQSKIQSLETELAEVVEANEMYKDQLKRLLSEQNSSETPMISGGDNEPDVKRQGINMLSVELELRDLRDRYFQMSLKYAEVEAQREELVLKLKSTNNRRWFS